MFIYQIKESSLADDNDEDVIEVQQEVDVRGGGESRRENE
jgi:hypothetical protein